MNFSLCTAFAASHKFWYVVFSFSSVSRYFPISFVISSLTHWLFKSVLFNFHKFVNFSVFILLLISEFICCGQKRYFVSYLSFKMYQGLICGLTYGLSWEGLMCTWEECVFLGRVLHMSFRSSWFIVLFKSSRVEYWSLPTITIKLFLPSMLSVFASYILMACS